MTIDLTTITDSISKLMVDVMPDILLAAFYLLVGFWLAGRVKAMFLKLAEKSDRVDNTLAYFFAGLAKSLIIIVTLLIILDSFGVKTTSLLAVFGAAGLAIGLALQGTLSHIAAGVMLLMFRPFKVGDYIRAGGEEGTAKVISLFTTELDTLDNVRVILPNGAVWGSSIVNFSYHDTRRAQLLFGIGYGEDMEKAMTVIRSILDADDRCLQDPEPVIAVTTLNDSSVDIMVRFWCARPDFATLQWDVTQKVKEAFDKENIEIPYPTMTLIQHSE